MPGPATSLFRLRPRQAVSAHETFTYDVSVDGASFLVNAAIEQSNPTPLSIVLAGRPS